MRLPVDCARKSSRAAVAAVPLFLVAAAPAATADPKGGDRWIGTWAAAPQPFMPGHIQIFRNQTVRLIVHTSIGGTKLRIRLSNTYGDRPLVIGSAHVARRAAGPGSSD